MNLLLFKIANTIMGLSQLGETRFPDNPELQFLDPILDAVKTVLPALLILVSTAGTIYAVILGVNMAKAESAEKREEAKKRIINAILALVITIVLILLLQLFEANIGKWINTSNPV